MNPKSAHVNTAPKSDSEELFAMVARLGIVSGLLGWSLFAPATVNAGSCFTCASGVCSEAHPASSGMEYCQQNGGNCVASDICS
jgi:hypothetical protein